MKGTGVVYFATPTPPIAGEIEVTTYGWVHVRGPARRMGREGEHHDRPMDALAVSVPARTVFRIEWAELKVFL